MSCNVRRYVGETDVVITLSFSTSEPALILYGGHDDAIPTSSEFLWESSICDVIVDLDR